MDGKLQALPTKLYGAVSNPLTRDAPSWLLKDVLQAKGVKRGEPLSDDARAERLLRSICPGEDDAWPDGEADESVLDFVSRRFDPFVGQVLLDAAFSGVYAGDVKQLSARAVMNRLWRAEARRGSVVAGLFAERDRSKHSESAFVQACKGSSSVSFMDGMGTLPDALLHSLEQAGGGGHPAARVSVLSSTRILSMRQEPGSKHTVLQYQGHGTGQVQTMSVDAVISTLPAPALAGVLESGSGADSSMSSCKTAVDALRGIHYGSVAIVCMGWRHGVSAHSPNRQSSPWPALRYTGFGYLVPSGQRGPAVPPGGGQALLQQARDWDGKTAPVPPVPVLGMVWDSAVFPGQSDAWKRAVRAGAVPPGHTPGMPWSAGEVWESARQSETRVSVMTGGAMWPDACSLPDDDLAAIAQATLATHMRAPGGSGTASVCTPHSVGVYRAQQAIPQYNAGHTARVRALDSALGSLYHGRLWLAGNAYRGVGVADAISNGLQAGRRAVQGLVKEGVAAPR